MGSAAPESGWVPQWTPPEPRTSVESEILRLAKSPHFRARRETREEFHKISKKPENKDLYEREDALED